MLVVSATENSHLQGTQIAAGEKFEIASGIEVQKMLNKDLRISAGARYNFAYELKGDEANTSTYSQSVIGEIGLQWDIPRSTKK